MFDNRVKQRVGLSQHEQVESQNRAIAMRRQIDYFLTLVTVLFFLGLNVSHAGTAFESSAKAAEDTAKKALNGAKDVTCLNN